MNVYTLVCHDIGDGDGPYFTIAQGTHKECAEMLSRIKQTARSIAGLVVIPGRDGDNCAIARAFPIATRTQADCLRFAIVRPDIPGEAEKDIIATLRYMAGWPSPS